MAQRTGTIQSVIHAQGSGIAEVELTDGTRWAADAGPLFRAFYRAFGDEGPVGQEIGLETEGRMLVSFMPLAEMDEEDPAG